MNFKHLGSRICIIGLSNSGKSTLAVRLGRKTSLPVYHLDQMAHIPFTNWQRKTDEAFVREHDRLIEGESWIIEGNYRICMPQRFDRATGVVWLDPPIPGSVWRYMARCLRRDQTRPGRLEGATGEFNLRHIGYMLFVYPKNRERYKAFLENRTLSILHLRSMSELNRFSGNWNL
jgi:GTPase SAR1 family protein